MNSIKFENPWLLFLAIPLIALVVVGFFLVPKQKRFRPKNIISLCLHVVIAITLSFAFSNMQFLTSSKKTEVFLVADCSDSQSGNAQQIEDTIKKVYSGTNSQTSVGVIAFGKDQKIVTALGSSYKDKTIEGIFEDDSFDGSATDIYSALNFANDNFDEDAVKRVILITDGIETDNSAMNAIDKLLANNVSIDTVSLDEVSGDEAAITGIEYTDHCFVGRNETVKVYIRSKKQASASVQITSGGSVLADGKQTVELARGLNTLSFTLDSSAEGSKDYTIELSCPTDTFKQNNVRSFTQDYTTKFNVLFIGKTEAELESFKALNDFSDDQIKSYIDTTNVPYKLSDLITYDEIVLSNTDVTALDNSDEFVTSLNRAVSEYGKTLMTYGQTYSGQEGNANAATYNDLLPVQYNTDDAKALVLLIDNSGSMSTDSRLTKAKKGAIKMLDILGENDMVSIIGFESNVKVYQPMTSVKNKDQIIKAINKITEGGGTVMNPGLEQASKQLQGLDIEYKNVITLSDGEPSDSSKCQKTVKSMAANNIRCSFINISNSSGASLLKKLAQYGNGSYYYVRTAASLENVILTSVSSNMANQPITEDAPYDITIQNKNDPSLSNVDTSKLTQISGYNFCRLKSGANTIMTVQYKKEITDEAGNSNTEVVTVPLYAYWDYGQGRVASFTSDIGSSWTANFRASTAGSGFLKGMITQNLPSRAATNQLEITYTNNGFTSNVSVLAADNDANGRVHIVVKDPNGTTKDSYDFYYDGSYYSGVVKLSLGSDNKVITGKYILDITYQKKDDNGNFQDTSDKGSFPLQFDYSKEYESFSDTNAESTLFRIAKYANGSYSTAANYAYVASTNEAEVQSYNSTMFFFLIFSVVLYIIDIFLRKTEFKNFRKKQKMGI